VIKVFLELLILPFQLLRRLFLFTGVFGTATLSVAGTGFQKLERIFGLKNLRGIERETSGIKGA